MSKPQLHINRRDGKAFIAYLYLNRDALPVRVDHTWRCRSFGVDYTRTGRIVGIEIFDPRPERASELKALLRELMIDGVTDVVLSPLGNAS